jgi:hypothetical protein
MPAVMPPPPARAGTIVAPSPAPPAPPPAPGPFTIGYSFGVRAGVRLQDPDNKKDMDEFHLDPWSYDSVVEARFHGTVLEHFSWVANFNAGINTGGGLSGVNGALSIMDLIAQYKAADEFQVWAGRLLVPSDRANFAGPFFMIPWVYPGFYIKGAAPIGPKDNANGRDIGITVWGNAIESKLKYYAGVYGFGGPTLADQDQPPYYSGRISYSLQGDEAGYFGSETYYGAKSVATIGLGGQYQKADPAKGIPKDVGIFMADAFAEEVTAAGTFTVEGQFYKFSDDYNFGGPVNAPSAALYGTLAWLMPDKAGIGQFQPALRVQETIDPAWTLIDAQLAYVIKNYSARLVTDYEHIGLGSTPTGQAHAQNALIFGVQLQNL